MLITVFSICAILAGGYDCDEKWAVYIYDDFDVFKYCYPNTKGLYHAVMGCSTYDDNRGHSMILGRNGIGITHTGDTILAHEIKHLQCLCNYHSNPPESPKR